MLALEGLVGGQPHLAGQWEQMWGTAGVPRAELSLLEGRRGTGPSRAQSQHAKPGWQRRMGGCRSPCESSWHCSGAGRSRKGLTGKCSNSSLVGRVSHLQAAPSKEGGAGCTLGPGRWAPWHPKTDSHPTPVSSEGPSWGLLDTGAAPTCTHFAKGAPEGGGGASQPLAQWRQRPGHGSGGGVPSALTPSPGTSPWVTPGAGCLWVPTGREGPRGHPHPQDHPWGITPRTHPQHPWAQQPQPRHSGHPPLPWADIGGVWVGEKGVPFGDRALHPVYHCWSRAATPAVPCRGRELRVFFFGGAGHPWAAWTSAASRGDIPQCSQQAPAASRCSLLS